MTPLSDYGPTETPPVAECIAYVDYYDGPLSAVWRVSEGFYWYGQWYDGDDRERWLFAEMTREQLRAFLAGEVTMREGFAAASALWLGDTVENLRVRVRYEQLDEGCLPEAECRGDGGAHDGEALIAEWLLP